VPLPADGSSRGIRIADSAQAFQPIEGANSVRTADSYRKAVTSIPALTPPEKQKAQLLNFEKLRLVVLTLCSCWRRAPRRLRILVAQTGDYGAMLQRHVASCQVCKIGSIFNSQLNLVS
jgi:hypothetical protein